jgi:hypothetical protein
MTAAKLIRPDIDPDEQAARDLSWIDELNPQTETQHRLAGRLLTASHQRDCCDLQFAGIINDQVRNAPANFDRALEDQFEDAKLKYFSDPPEAVSQLRQTSLGCTWLVHRAEGVRDRLDELGAMTNVDIRETIRLHGDKLLANSHNSPEAFVLQFHGRLSQPPSNVYEGDWNYGDVPKSLLSQYLARWPDRQAHTAELLNRLDALISELSERAKTLAAEEDIKRQGCVQRALLIADPTEAGLWDRYSKDADRALFRALEEYRAEKAWEAARAAEAADAEEIEDEEEAVTDNSPPPEPGPEIGVPCEAGAETTVAEAETIESEPTPVAEPVAALSSKTREMLKNIPPGLRREPVARALSENPRNEPGAPVGNSDTFSVPMSYVDISGILSARSARLGEPAGGGLVPVMPASPPNRPASG